MGAAISLASTLLHAQVDDVYIYGNVKDYTSAKKLEGVTVTIFKNGAKLVETVTNASGKYEMNVDFGADYKLMCSKPGFVGKNILIDTRNVPEEERSGGLGMNIDFTMLQSIPDMDFSVLEQPFGKAKFDGTTGTLSWDMAYTEHMRSEQARLLREYDEKRKRELGEEADFAKLLAEGTAAMTAKEYAKAIEKFNAALAVKPNDAIAKAKLSDAQMKLAELEGEKKLNEQYAALIKDGDALFVKKDYVNAKAKFSQALDMRDDEPYPRQKVQECDQLIADLEKKAKEEREAKELEEKYKAAITAADAAFKGANYEAARSKYTSASELKPAEQYPKDQLAAIVKKLDELAKKAEEDRLKAEEEKRLKEIEAKYTAAIVAADAAFKAGNYEQARTKYEEALTIKAEEKYPKDQLAAIVQKLKDLADQAEKDRLQKELEDKYNAAIKAGDAAFKSDRFDEAKAGYNEALTLKKDEKYPKDQLLAIDKRIEELAKKADEDEKKRKLDEQYAAAIVAADAAFSTSMFDEARAKYNEALGLKKDERYPKDQLAAIDKKIADKAKADEEARKQAEIDAKYQKLVDEGNEMFRTEGYTGARAKFVEAGGVKPAEKYPKDRIAEIDAKLAELKRLEEEEKKRQELEAKYAALINKADGEYDSKKLDDALKDYEDALALKPNEQHPAQRISAIRSQMDADALAKSEAERLERERAEQERRYAELIAKADKSFGAKEYGSARTNYSDALGVKPGEKHPTERLAEIDRILKELADKEAADRSLAEKDAAERARLEEENRKKQAEMDALEQQYREIIAAADLAFDGDNFDLARDRYTEALTVKPAEQYPKDRLQAIEDEMARRLKDQSEAERLEAQRLRDEEDRKRREAEEAEAARLRADDERNKLASERELDERYRAIILQADSGLAAKAYQEARSLYGQAMDVKPGETYPQAKIEQIDKLLAEQARQEEEDRLARERAAQTEPNQRSGTANIDNSKAEDAEKFMRDARLREEAEKNERIKKLKHDVSAAENAEMEAAALRREQGTTRKDLQERSSGELFSGSEEQRMSNAERVAAQKEALAAAERARIERTANGRDAAYAAKINTEQEISNKQAGWNEHHHTQTENAAHQAEIYNVAEQQRIQGSNDRREDAVHASRAYERSQGDLKERGDGMAVDNQQRVEDDKSQARSAEAIRIATQEGNRTAAKDRLDRIEGNKPKDYQDYNPNKLAHEYPQGVTEESYTEGNKVIIRRIVVEGNKADTYSKVIAKWGTNYFKNGQAISEEIWRSDTEE